MRTPQKIVHVVRSLECGGLERLALDLAIAQIADGNFAEIYTIYKHEQALLSEAQRAGVRVVQFNKSTGFSMGTLRKMAFQLRRDRVSIVHTHNELVHTYGTIAGRLAGVPCVISTIHGTKRGADLRLDRNYKFLLPWTDAVVAVSSETLDQFAAERARCPNKFHVIRNGIPVSKFVAQSARPGSEWPHIRFGTVARLVDVKDQATLIRAFHKVLRTYPTAQLHILGDGPLRANLESLANQLDIFRNVTFRGASPNVTGFLNGLDVFVLSSLSEGLPLSILEAMAAGLPIVSTKVGGIHEVAPEDQVAKYCPPADPEALAHSMESVLDPQRLQAMGQSGQNIAQHSFTISSMSREYECVYDSLLARKSYVWSSLIPRWS